MNARASSSTAAENSAAPAVVVGVESAPRYRVFLSYSHNDTGWARWLMRRLEGFRVPERFHGRAAPMGEVGARIAPVFRDRDELPTTSDLGETIRTALRQSATLVVICSPASAKSRWVQEEILEFKRLGGSARVFAFIVGGEPKAEGAEDDCFSPALRRELGADGELSANLAEVVAADARPQGDGREDAFIRLVAGLLGVGFDDLRQREHVRRHRRMLWITAAAVAGMAITLGLALFALKARNEALVARNDAQRRQERGEKMMADMLNDMKTGLQKADKLDALDETGAKLMGYFQSLDPRDLTDTTLTQQAKALTQIGQMRIAQLRYPEASAAFTIALKRSAALVERHPRDGDMRFERAQAEYWIGFVHYRKGELALASEWFVRYRDSSVALAGLDPKNPKWLREAVSGYHNLAVVELARGNLAAARNGFLGERAALEKITMSDPLEVAELQSSLANADSFLGTVADRVGDFAEAVARFGMQIERIEGQVNADPRSARMKQRLATALGLQSDTMAISGKRIAALERRRRSLDIFDALAVQDAANREWQVSALTARLKYALLLRAQGDASGAARIVQECRPALEKLAKLAPSNRSVMSALALAWRLEAQLRDTTGEPGATEAATCAIAAAKTLLELDRADDNNLIIYANAFIAAGMIAQSAGDTATAHRDFQAALDAVEERVRASTSVRLLDPAARALALLGRTEESRAVQERLAQVRFQSLEPWPENSGSRTLSAEIQH